MTILPKKKSSAKGEVGENADSNPHHGTHQHHIIPHQIQQNEARGDVVGVGVRIFPGRNSPPRGWPPPSSREEKRPALGNPSGFEDYDSSLESGPSHSKRRHRASPHRSVRNKHREHNSRNSPNCPGSVGGGNNACSGSNSACGGGGNASSLLGASAASTSNSAAIASNASPPSSASTSGENGGNSEDYSGYNSGDEYVNPPVLWLTEDEWSERERMFEKKMRKKGFLIKQMGEDGACLFRAVADQVYGDQEMHSLVRRHCMEYMNKNTDYFSQYITEDFETYIARKSMDHIHGNHVEMQAMSELFNRTMEVYHYSTDPINIIRGGLNTDNEPIRISYHKNIHYNSIVDPYKATVGVGLGLPGLVPGLAEKNQMRDAIRHSEDFQLEQAMLEDKLKATDWEATNEAIEEQVARESYLQWLRDNEKRARKQGMQSRSATATSSSSLALAGGSDAMLTPLRSPLSQGNRSPRSSSNSKGSSSPGSSSPQRDPTTVVVDDGACAPSSETNTSFNMMSGSPSLAGTSGSGLCGGAVGGVAPSPNVASVSSDHGPSTCGVSELLGPDFAILETASFMNQLPPDVFGLNEWEDADILAQVLAASQQEYLDSLKRTAASGGSCGSGSGSTTAAATLLLPTSQPPLQRNDGCSTSAQSSNMFCPLLTIADVSDVDGAVEDMAS